MRSGPTRPRGRRAIPIRRLFEEQRRVFRAGLPQRRADIRAALDALSPGQPSEGLATLYRLIHNLAGAGGTFGMPVLTDLARPIAQGLRPHLRAEGEPLDALSLEAIRAEVEALLAAMEAAAAAGDEGGADSP